MPVYFIQAGDSDGPVKIGHGTNPRQRLREMQVGNHRKLALLAVCEGGRAEEGMLHHRFSRHRIAGEWFSPAPDLLTLIARQTPYRAPRRKNAVGDNKLARWLEANGVTRSRFAALIGVSPSYLVFLCKSACWPSRKVAAAILKHTKGAIGPSDFLPERQAS